MRIFFGKVLDRRSHHISAECPAWLAVIDKKLYNTTNTRQRSLFMDKIPWFLTYFGVVSCVVAAALVAVRLLG
jgi:negative regulator of sigma E activity